MAQKASSQDAKVVDGRIIMPYTYYMGPVAREFYKQIKNSKKLYGTKCEQCNLIFLPPKPNCNRCLNKLDQMVEVDNKGTVLTYTVTYYPIKIQPVKPPIVYAVIQLDGAATGIVHMLGDVDPSEVKIGMRVEAVFEDVPKGNILDIKYFKPIK